jgi:hypothetical protein
MAVVVLCMFKRDSKLVGVLQMNMKAVYPLLVYGRGDSLWHRMRR